MFRNVEYRHWVGKESCIEHDVIEAAENVIKSQSEWCETALFTFETPINNMLRCLTYCCSGRNTGRWTGDIDAHSYWHLIHLPSTAFQKPKNSYFYGLHFEKIRKFNPHFYKLTRWFYSSQENASVATSILNGCVRETKTRVRKKICFVIFLLVYA